MPGRLKPGFSEAKARSGVARNRCDAASIRRGRRGESTNVKLFSRMSLACEREARNFALDDGMSRALTSAEMKTRDVVNVAALTTSFALYRREACSFFMAALTMSAQKYSGTWRRATCGREAGRGACHLGGRAVVMARK